MAEQNSSSCSGNCSSCSSNCADRDPKSLIEPTKDVNKIKKVIGVVSGKGGVGKSMVTSLLAVQMRRLGKEVAILDADITGPSIPKAFGLNGRAEGSELGIFPALTETGIKVMSINLLLEDNTAPVVWRGPVIAGAVKQFWSDVLWNDVDYMFVDCPPGTGDVPLTVFQSLPLDGIIIVSSPQDLVSMIVKKAYKMAEMMNIPVLGIVENMSYVKCPDCGKRIDIFSSGKTQTVADELGVPLLAKMPIDKDLATLVDNGCIERVQTEPLMDAAKMLEELK